MRRENFEKSINTINELKQDGIEKDDTCRHYTSNSAKPENEFAWKADENFDTGIVKTIKWYLGKYNK